MKNKAKALKAIEYLTGSDFAMQLEWILTDDTNIKDSIKMLNEAAELIGQIYRIAHAEGKCKHPDWQLEKDKVIKAYKDL